MFPGDEITIRIEYRNKSFAIKAHVRQVVDATARMSVASDCNDNKLVVRTVLCAPDASDLAPMDQWEMTADGTPFLKTITTNYVDPSYLWASMALSNNIDSETSSLKQAMDSCGGNTKFMERRFPFGMIDQFLLTIGF